MTSVDTLTVNPTIDIAYEVDRLEPVRKMRARNERHDPGGGGINVARVFVRLGGNARCHYLAGGPTGVTLDALLDRHQLVKACTPIAGDTRTSTTIYEASTGREFRVVAPGPEITASEWGSCLDRLGQTRADYIVASGSLARGLPDDFYARAARAAQAAGARFVLDSSGRGLAGGLAGGGVFLVKPSLEELCDLVDDELRSEDDFTRAAQDIVRRGQAEYVAVSMADRGALLAGRDGIVRLDALKVETRSTVGAGDSFVAAMVHGLASGKPIEEAFRFGIAAGAAAVSTPGTDLARAEDIRRLFEEVPVPA